MSGTQYLRGTPADRADIVDFANYVFSQAHEPHDFKTLLPKTYADDVTGMEAWHFLAKENGRIRALVCNRPMKMRILDRTLSCGLVGTVSVHPYARGEGHMKRLMNDMLADARGKYDFLILGGQRQRYNYFGFEHLGTVLRYKITGAGLRHCLKDTDVSDIALTDLTNDRPEELAFVRSLMDRRAVCGERPEEYLLHILRSWNQRARLVRIGGQMAGYLTGTVGEIGLTDEAQLPRVLKALFQADGLTWARIDAAPYEKERIRALAGLYEERSIETYEMVHVLNWVPFVQALLSLKASYSRLADGIFTLAVENEGAFTIQVEQGVPRVTEARRPADAALSHLEAQRLLLGLENALCCDGPLPSSWLPLPFYMSNVDSF